jgi:hypothetical protein
MIKEKLIRNGWEFRGVFSEPRLSEFCELYRELGFEVLVLPYEGNEDSECKLCYDFKEGLEYKLVLTKKQES